MENDASQEELKPKIKIRKKKREDFLFGPILGEGSYSTVCLATEIESGKEFAVKILQKRHIIKEKKVPQVEREKRVLNRLDHPFFVKLYFTFQDSERLYFGLSVARRGELQSKIMQLGRFDVECTRFYTAQIISALEHMHSLNIIHRDLKPENILFNDQMHIQITDFGTAKEVDANEDGEQTVAVPRTSSFVGTAQYVSPELLRNKQACASSDLWALGCIVYQMLVGDFPFKAPNEYLTFQKIIAGQYCLPSDITDEDAHNLVENLLKLDPLERIGCEQRGGYDELKRHPFFNGVDWDRLGEAKLPEAMAQLMDDDEDDDGANDAGGGEGETLQDLSDDFERAAISDFKEHQRNEQSVNGKIERLSPSEPDDASGFGLNVNMTREQRNSCLMKQKQSDWNYFAQGKLILKRGVLEKKRGFSVKVRQFLLVEGPRLIYIDPSSKQVKGEVPWSSALWCEPRSFRVFLVHTPHRTYHLIDKSNNAIKWCKKIEEIKRIYFEVA